MTDLLVQDPVYISLEDFRDTTSNADLANALTVDDDALKGIIYNSQMIIDDYISHYGLQFEDGQIFIFPNRDSDGDAIDIPNDISVATVYVGEAFYEGSSGTTTTGKIKTVKTGPRTIEYFEPGVGGSSAYINQKAKTILDRYKTQFFISEL